METGIIRGIIRAHTHTCTAGLSVDDRYEKGVVLTHWLSGMLQPQHLTGPYLPWADCTAWYASVIFVGKKDTAVKARWVKKKTGQWHKLTPCGFCMTMIICLFAWTPWPSRCSSRMQRMHHVKRRYLHSYTVKHLIADRACAYRPAQVYICAVLPIKKHTRSRLSSFHHGHHHNFR